MATSTAEVSMLPFFALHSAGTAITARSASRQAASPSVTAVRFSSARAKYLSVSSSRRGLTRRLIFSTLSGSGSARITR